MLTIIAVIADSMTIRVFPIPEKNELRQFRNRLTHEFGDLYHDLEAAISPAAILDPHGAEAVFAKRDRARARLQDIIMEVVSERSRASRRWM